MATFKFGRYIDIHWNGYDIQGPADTVFSIPDQLYEEFDADIAPVEPTLQWIDTNEFQTLSNSVSASSLSATFPIALTTSSTGKTISFSSSTNPNGYLLAADGSGGVIFTPASTSGLTSVVGVSPISTAVSGGTVSVSINQAALSVSDAETATVLRTYVKNSSGSTITKGQVVYITGADGTNALIGLASNTSDASSSKTLGIAANTMTNNAFGYVIENGQLSNIDTSAATAGAAVWLGSTPGSYQFTVPAEPNHAVYLGVVTKANVSTGEILVKVQNGYELNELHDVFTTGVSSSLPLVYNATSDGWIAQALSSVGIADNAIVTTKILDGAVTSAKIAASAINSTHIGPNAVVSGDIAAGVVGSAELATGAVVSSKIATGAVTSGHISTGAVGSSALAASSVVSAAIAANAVTSGHIAAGAVGSAALADNAVVAAKINAGAVGTAKITSGAALNGYVLTADGAGAAAFLAASSGISTVSISTFTASGTWTKPSGVTAVYVLAFGGGGGGGGGATTYGGGGGGGAAVVSRIFPASILGATASVTIGAGGTGGAATADGNVGGTTIFNATDTTDANLRALGGGSGPGTATGLVSRSPQSLAKWAGALNTPVATGNSFNVNQADGCGGESSTSAGTQSPVSTGFAVYSAGGGGAGSGTTAGTGNYGRGGLGNAYSTGWPSGGATSGGVGGSATQNFCGGAGGGGNAAGAGGAGGAGKFGGGGGGGGRGSTAGGAGGAGGDGYCLVISW